MFLGFRVLQLCFQPVEKIQNWIRKTAAFVAVFAVCLRGVRVVGGDHTDICTYTCKYTYICTYMYIHIYIYINVLLFVWVVHFFAWAPGRLVAQYLEANTAPDTYLASGDSYVGHGQNSSSLGGYMEIA